MKRARELVPAEDQRIGVAGGDFAARAHPAPARSPPVVVLTSLPSVARPVRRDVGGRGGDGVFGAHRRSFCVGLLFVAFIAIVVVE